MLRTPLLAALLLCAAACGPTSTEPVQARVTRAAHDDQTPPPPPPDTTTVQGDTTNRGGGTMGSGT